MRCICYYGDYEEGYNVDFRCPQATEQQKTITDHSRNVIVILYIVFILNMVNILKVCTCKQKFLFAHIYCNCKLMFFVFVCIDCYLQIVKSCTDFDMTSHKHIYVTYLNMYLFVCHFVYYQMINPLHPMPFLWLVSPYTLNFLGS